MQVPGFCYFGVVKAPERLERILRLLPPRERDACTAWLAGLQGMPPPQARNRWERERTAERAALVAAAQKRAGGQLFSLPGRVQTLLLRRTRRQIQEP